MFKLKLARTIVWPVTIQVPVDGGTLEPVEVKGTFREVGVTEAAEMLRQPDTDVVRAVLVGWEGIGDAEGNALEFSEENLSKLLDIGYARLGFIKAWMELQAGAAAKN